MRVEGVVAATGPICWVGSHPARKKKPASARLLHPPLGGVLSCCTLHHKGCLRPLCTWPRAGAGVVSSPSGWAEAGPRDRPTPRPSEHPSSPRFRNSSWRPQCINNPLPHFLLLPSFSSFSSLEGVGGRSPHTLVPLLQLWRLTPQQAGH